MPPIDPDEQRAPGARPASRKTRAAAVLAGAAVIVTGSALPALANNGPILASSCADVAAATPGAADGDYQIMLAGASTTVFCADMAGTPRAYLTLPSTGGNLNFSSSSWWSSSSWDARTDWTRVRIVNSGEVVDGTTCASDACVDTNDGLFSTTTGRFMRYTMADGPHYYHGYARADFTGTPFAMDPASISQQGYDMQGSITFSHDNQVVYLDGKGNNGWTSTVGNLLPLFRMTRPAAPTSPTATRGNGSATLSFTPGNNGHATVTGYEVSSGDGFTPLTTTESNGTVTGTVSGLTNGTPYTFTVRAINSVGTSDASEVATATPAGVPSAPTGLTAARGDSSATLSFAPGDDGGDAVTGYEVSTGNGFAPLSTTTQPDGIVTGTVSGLTNGTGYTFSVRATNSVGTGDASASATATPATTPSAPTDLVATPTLGGVFLSFTPAEDGGDAVTGYEVSTGGTFSPLATTLSGGTRSAAVNGLVGGNSYTIRVRAVNGVGSGTAAETTQTPLSLIIPPVLPPFVPPVLPPFVPPVIPPVVPPVTPPVTPPVVPPMTAPTNLVATAGDGSAALSFSPAGGGSSPISRYEVSTGGAWTPLATSPGTAGNLRGTVRGLTNGVTYQVRVRGVGSSTSPVASTTVRPDPIPGKYADLGGSHSVVGAPIGSEFSVAGGLGQRYQNGWIYWSPRSGVHEVHGIIGGHYVALGGPNGLLGFPLTDETATPDHVGRYNHFAGADGSSIYWTPQTGAWSVHGAIRDQWAATGWERGPIGYPTSDERPGVNGGRYNHFAGSGGSSVYWTPRTGAHLVYGAIHARWAEMGFERGRLGYPTTSEYGFTGGRRTDFVGGSILRYTNGRTVVLFR